MAADPQSSGPNANAEISGKQGLRPCPGGVVGGTTWHVRIAEPLRCRYDQHARITRAANTKSPARQATARQATAPTTVPQTMQAIALKTQRERVQGNNRSNAGSPGVQTERNRKNFRYRSKWPINQ